MVIAISCQMVIYSDSFTCILRQQITSSPDDRRDSTGNGHGYDSIRALSDNLNDKHCGSRADIDGDRIVGGEQTDAFQYPWNVALTLGWGLQFCGGSLINEWVRISSNSLISQNYLIKLLIKTSSTFLIQYALTAAHCVAWGRPALKMKIRIGEHNLTGNRKNQTYITESTKH